MGAPPTIKATVERPSLTCANRSQVAGGNWRTVRKRTTSRQATFDLGSGTHYFRVKALDNRGNVGGWRGPLRVDIP